MISCIYYTSQNPISKGTESGKAHFMRVWSKLVLPPLFLDPVSGGIGARCCGVAFWELPGAAGQAVEKINGVCGAGAVG